MKQILKLKVIMKKNKIYEKQYNDIFDDESVNNSINNNNNNEVQLTPRKWYKHQDNLINQQEVKEGRFTEMEINKILNVFNDFKESHGISETQLKDLIQNSSRGKLQVWLNIAKYVPNRRVQAIYRLIHRKFEENNKSGKWKKEQEQELIKYVNQYGRKWKLISKYINRTPDNLRNKYISLGEHNYMFRNKDSWRVEEFIQFCDLIHQQTGQQILKDDHQLQSEQYKHQTFIINYRKMNSKSQEIFMNLKNQVQLYYIY